MSRDPRFDILFEPVKIGPVTARNRFYQVPHCSGMGYRYPNAEAHLRGMKAEGGWAVVSTQEAEIHPTSDLTPANEARLWDDGDLPALNAVTERIHAHGSLAAIQLVHNGLHVANRFSRMIPLAPSHAISDSLDPVQARAMDKTDIADMRGWYRSAALRAKRAGFDIVYLYAGHDMSVLQHFLSRRHNDRSDEYGGSFENRLRLFREILDDVREAIGDSCALAVRLAVDELMGPSGITCEGEGKDIISALAEFPDLSDVNLSAWSNDSQTARFSEEGYQEPYIRFVKSVTTKPVVGVGRYTSPDSMVRVVKQGIVDFIGAARPSIADPYLPKKIEEGRIDDIRECIGCNICTSGDNTNVPMRCTQNPTIGEEWRKSWHPETIAISVAPEPALIIGGGPAGLEAARALAQRGVDVVLAEGSGEWGGRVARECRLPGLSTWGRVRDWRIGQLSTRVNAGLYLHSRLSASDVLQYGIPHVAIATGARWRIDGVGRTPQSTTRVSLARHPRLSRHHPFRWAAGGAGRWTCHRLRRRLLLYGQRARRTARQGRPHGHLHHAGIPGRPLEQKHAGTGTCSKAPHRTRGRDRHGHGSCRTHERSAGTVVRLQRQDPSGRLRHPRPGHCPPALRNSVAGAQGTRRRVG